MGTKTSTAPLTGDYRSYLQRQLTHAKARIKNSDMVSGLAMIAAGSLGFILLAVMIDQLVELPTYVRGISLVAFLCTIVTLTAFWIVTPFFRSINVRFAARSVEQADPRMKNSVLSWVELEQSEGNLAEPVMMAVGARAAADLSKVRIEDAIQPRNLLPSLYALAVVVVLFCAFSLVTTKSFGTSVKRVLFPWSGVAAPSSTEVALTFEPGEDAGKRPASLPFDGKLEVIAHVTRGNPENVVGYIRAEGSDYEEPAPFERSAPDSYEFKLSRAKVQRSLSLRVVAEDFESPIYTIPVSQPPVVVDWNIQYEPPSYTKQADFDSNSPNIDALEGTTVEIRATTNVDVDPSSGLIELNLEGVESTLPMTLVDGTANQLKGKLVLKENGTYRLNFRDVQGRMPEFRPSHDIRVRKDMPPVITFESPADKESRQPINRPLQLAGSVRDDFGLYQSSLVIIGPSGEKLLTKEVGGLEQDELSSQWSFNDSVDLTKTTVQPGDKLEYWVEAVDNKLPFGNTVNSRKLEHRTVIILPPEESPKNEPKADQKKEPAEKKNDPENATSPNDEKEEGEQSDTGNGEKGDGKPSDANDKSGSPTDDSHPSEDGKGEPSESSEGRGKNNAGESTPNDQKSSNDNPSDPANENDGTSDSSQKSGENSNDERQPEEQPTENGESSSANSGDRKLNDEDQKALDKLEKHFEEKNKAETPDSKDSNRADNQNEPSSNSDSKSKSDSDAKDQTTPNSKDQQSKPKQNESTDNPKSTQKESKESSDASSKQKPDPNKNNDPNSAENSDATDSNPKDDSSDRESNNTKSPPNNSSEAKRDNKQAGSEEPKENPDSPSRDQQQPGSNANDKKSGKSKEKDDQEADSKADKSAGNDKGADQEQPGNQTTDQKKSNDTSEKKESSSKEPAARDDSKENPGAGKSEESPDASRPDRAQPGDAAKKDNGDESQSSKDNAPKPSSESKKDQNPKGSHKEGQDNASSAPEGNQDGQASQGESSKSGQSSTGSPSKEEGDNPESSGEQKRKGQTEGEGDRQPGENSPASRDKKGKPTSNESGKESEGATGNKSNDNKSDKAEGGVKDSPSDGKSKGEAKEGDPKDATPNEREDASSPSKDESKSSSSKEESSSSSEEKSDSPTAAEPMNDANDSSPSPEDGKQPTDKPSDKGAEDGKPGDKPGSKPADGQETNDPKPNSDDQNPSGSQPSGGTRGNPEDGPESTLDDSGDQADENDRAKGSNLVLKKLEEQIKSKKIDPELLKEMGWTEQDARDFYNRLREQAAAEKTEVLSGGERRRFGQGTDLQKSTRTGAGKKNDAKQDLYSGQRTPTPPAIRKRFEAYTRGLSEETKSPPAPSPAESKPAPEAKTK